MFVGSHLTPDILSAHLQCSHRISASILLKSHFLGDKLIFGVKLLKFHLFVINLFWRKIIMHTGRIWKFQAGPSVTAWIFEDQNSADLAENQCKDQSGKFFQKNPIPDSLKSYLPPYRGSNLEVLS